MKYLLRRSLVFYVFAQISLAMHADDILDEPKEELVEFQDQQKRGIKLNNFPISIFIPQTQQFTQDNAIIKGITGETGAEQPCLFNLAMLRRINTTSLATGDTGTFDNGVLYRITSNPAGSPSFVTPTQSFTMQIPGYYLIEFTYAGDQTSIYTQQSFYAKFNLLVNGSLAQPFTLSTSGIRQVWQHIIFLNQGDTVSFQAASHIPFFTAPGVIDAGTVDGLIMTISWIGPCVTPD